MYPILFEWGDLVLPAWHAFYVLSAFAAFFLLSFLTRRHHQNISSQKVANVFAVSYLGGYFGARILSIVVEEEVLDFFDFLDRVFALGAMTFYGGAIGAAICGLTYLKWTRVPLGPVFDMAIPAGLLALAIGRIGCFLNGDDYGRPIPDSLQSGPPWWAVTFPNLQDGIARYPVQLISTLVVASFVAIVVLNYGKLQERFKPGGIGIACVLFYSVFRFLIEYWRGDPRGAVFANLFSTSQFISICLFGLCLVVGPSLLRTDRSG